MPAFVPDIATILAFSLATFILMITPGPDMALQMSRAINYGRGRMGWRRCSGRWRGSWCTRRWLALGISVLIIAAPPLFLALKIAGGVPAVARLPGDRAWRWAAAERGGQ